MNGGTGKGGERLPRLSCYLLALRPWSLSASLVPTLLGSALALKLEPSATLYWPLLLLILLTTLSVHCAGNVVNTYFDYVKGIDGGKSDDRTLVDHILSIEELVSLGVMLYSIGCAGFILLAMLSPARMEHLALIYFGGLSSSFLYTGGIGFKYIALGDVLILIIFGPISVLFAFMSLTGRLEMASIPFALPLALNTEAILHSNNTRDLESDRRAGIVTLAILLGRTSSRILYAFLLFTPYVAFVVLAARCSSYFLLPLVTLPSAFELEKRFRDGSPGLVQRVPRDTAKLNLYFGLLYVAALFLTPSSALPFLR